MRTQLPVSLPLGIIPQIISIWGAFLKSDVLFFVFAARKKTAALSVRRSLVLCRIILHAYNCEKILSHFCKDQSIRPAFLFL